jgi:YD repeat-containing protein
MDRWQRWEQGRLVSEDLDTDSDGAADRRVRYDAQGKVAALEPLAAK